MSSAAVTVDGHRVAGLRPGRSASVTVAAGEHVVQATMDWIRSAPMTLELRDDDTASVEVSVPERAWVQTWTRPSDALDIRRI